MIDKKRINMLKDILTKKPLDLDDKCDLFKFCNAEEYKELAVFALQTLCKTENFNYCRTNDAGWAAHHITKAIFEKQNIFDPYSDADFIASIEEACPWYVHPYTQKEFNTLKYKEYTDFVWKPYYPNNIVGNGLEGYDCFISPQVGYCKHYAIRFQHEADETGMIKSDAEPEIFILFESDSFIYACPSLDFAKRRAYAQYVNINGYAANQFESEKQRPQIKRIELAAHWVTDNYDSTTNEQIILMPDGSGMFKDYLSCKHIDIFWSVDDDVLFVEDKYGRGFYLDYCAPLILEKDISTIDTITDNPRICDRLIIGNRVFYKQMTIIPSFA